jgi:Flp pilus assembly protein TadG
MQRLTVRLRRRLAGERGAAAVLMALVLVPMLGFTAVAVDIGAVYAERARLQVAADSAALAVAQDCARGACGDMQATASAMVAANEGGATAAPPVLSSAPLSVTVTGDKPTRHWFAPVLGIDSTQVSATATVAWGFPGAGTAVLPLTFSWCEFDQQTHGGLPSGTTVRTIHFTKTSGTVGCTGPSGNVVPGGFAWIDPDTGTCNATSALNGRMTSKTGKSVPTSCTAPDFAAWLGHTVLLPLFVNYGGSGTDAWYQVYGYAAFTITDYCFGNQNSSVSGCNGTDRWIAGYFTRFVDVSERFTYTNLGPDLGADILRLIR